MSGLPRTGCSLLAEFVPQEGEISPTDLRELQHAVESAQKDEAHLMEGLATLHSFVRREPHIPLGYLLRAQLFERQGDLRHAAGDLRTALRLRPTLLPVAVQLADLTAQMYLSSHLPLAAVLILPSGEPERALELLDQQLLAHPTSWLARSSRVNVISYASDLP